MLTLKELLLDLNQDDYFRIYNPNRDCLEFESFYIPHGPWAKTDSFIFQKPSLRTSYEDLDEETKKLLDDFGDYVVFSIECSSTSCTDFYRNDKGDMEWKQSDAYPHEHAPVLNIFIRPKKESELENKSITNLMAGMMSGDLLKQKDLPESTLAGLTEPKGLHDDIICPYCGKKHFIETFSTATAVAVVKEYKDGKLVPHENPNVYITHFRCCECGKEFISENGVVKKFTQPETLDLNLNWTKDSHISIEDYYNDKYTYDELTLVFNDIVDNKE